MTLIGSRSAPDENAESQLAVSIQSSPGGQNLESQGAVTGLRNFVRRHALTTYFVGVVGISWTIGLIVLGPDVFRGLKPMPREQLIPVLLGVWAGTTIAGVASVALVSGTAGLRDLKDRWLRWRVGWGWYAMALLTAPLLATSILLSLTVITGSREYMPTLISSADKVGVLVLAVAVALLNSFFEEMGWTGFAVPQFLKRYGFAATGLILGLLWGAWHFPMFAGDATVEPPFAPAAYLALLLFGWLPPYRILMVWAYQRTQSVLIAWLMHVAIDFNALAIIPTTNKEAGVWYIVIFAAALWAIALGLTVRGGAKLRRAVSLPSPV